MSENLKKKKSNGMGVLGEGGKSEEDPFADEISEKYPDLRWKKKDACGRKPLKEKKVKIPLL